MPQIKERNQNDKIKKPGKAQQSKGVLRIMTAKLRKNMAQHGQQGEEHTADTQAVEQSTVILRYAEKPVPGALDAMRETLINQNFSAEKHSISCKNDKNMV